MTVLYWRDTGTPDFDYDLSDVQGTPTTIETPINDGNYIEVARWVSNLGQMNSVGDIIGSIKVLSLFGDTSFRYRVAQLDSAGNTVAASEYSLEYEGTGTYSDTFTLDTQWSEGDQIAVILETQRVRGMAADNRIELALNDPDTSLDADIAFTLPPQAAPGINNTGRSQTTVDLAWTEVPNASGYELERNQSNIFTGNSLSHQDTGLVSEGTYSYRVRAYNAQGPGPWSDEITVTTLAELLASFSLDHSQSVDLDHVFIQRSSAELSIDVFQSAGVGVSAHKVVSIEDSVAQGMAYDVGSRVAVSAGEANYTTDISLSYNSLELVVSEGVSMNPHTISLDTDIGVEAGVEVTLNTDISLDIGGRIESDWTDFVEVESTEEYIDADVVIEHTQVIEAAVESDKYVDVSVDASQGVSLSSDSAEHVDGSVEFVSGSAVDIAISSDVSKAYGVDLAQSVDIDSRSHEYAEGEVATQTVQSVTVNYNPIKTSSYEVDLSQEMSVDVVSRESVFAIVEFGAVQECVIDITPHKTVAVLVDDDIRVMISYDLDMDATAFIYIDTEQSIGLAVSVDKRPEVSFDSAQEVVEEAYKTVGQTTETAISLHLDTSYLPSPHISIDTEVSSDMSMSYVVGAGAGVSTANTTTLYIDANKSFDDSVEFASITDMDATVSKATGSFAVFEVAQEVVYDVSKHISDAVEFGLVTFIDKKSKMPSIPVFLTLYVAQRKDAGSLECARLRVTVYGAERVPVVIGGLGEVTKKEISAGQRRPVRVYDEPEAEVPELELNMV